MTAHNVRTGQFFRAAAEFKYNNENRNRSLNYNNWFDLINRTLAKCVQLEICGWYYKDTTAYATTISV